MVALLGATLVPMTLGISILSIVSYLGILHLTISQIIFLGGCYAGLGLFGFFLLLVGKK